MISRSSPGRSGRAVTSSNIFLVCMCLVLSRAVLGRAATQPAVPPRFPACCGSREGPGAPGALQGFGSGVISDPPATARISAARALCTWLMALLPVSVVAEGGPSVPESRYPNPPRGGGEEDVTGRNVLRTSG